jgi:Domain of unknown function (DUF4157)
LPYLCRLTIDINTPQEYLKRALCFLLTKDISPASRQLFRLNIVRGKEVTMRTFVRKQNPPQRTPTLNRTGTSSAVSATRQVHTILHLQRTIGNQAVQRLLRASADGLDVGSGATATTRFAHDFSGISVYAKAPTGIQTKLTVNAPGDAYEQEADRVADQVMRTPDPQLQRACTCGGACPKCQTQQPGQEHEHVQTKRVGSSDTRQIAAPPIVHEVLASPGQLLDPATSTFMEPRFGRDFGHIRVHTDEKAWDSARAVNALAYTAGHHLVFGAGQYSPATASGRRLLAHELAHSIQQGSAPEPLPQPVGAARNAPEHRADEAANGIIKNDLLPSSGNTVSTAATGGTTLLQRQAPDIVPPPLEVPPIYVRTTQIAYETATSRVLSWGRDTCCSNLGFPDPAKNRTPGAECCNTFPKFVDNEARKLGHDGAASCRPDRRGRTATVTPRDKSKTAVTVVCTDTRAFSKKPAVINTIELGFQAAAKYGKPPLDEVGEVSYGGIVTGTCSHVTDCGKTVNPKESQCLSPDCSK